MLFKMRSPTNYLKGMIMYFDFFVCDNTVTIYTKQWGFFLLEGQSN